MPKHSSTIDNGDVAILNGTERAAAKSSNDTAKANAGHNGTAARAQRIENAGYLSRLAAATQTAQEGMTGVDGTRESNMDDEAAQHAHSRFSAIPDGVAEGVVLPVDTAIRKGWAE